jgi:hypothetical protein
MVEGKESFKKVVNSKYTICMYGNIKMDKLLSTILYTNTKKKFKIHFSTFVR